MRFGETAISDRHKQRTPSLEKGQEEMTVFVPQAVSMIIILSRLEYVVLTAILEGQRQSC